MKAFFDSRSSPLTKSEGNRYSHARQRTLIGIRIFLTPLCRLATNSALLLSTSGRRSRTSLATFIVDRKWLRRSSSTSPLYDTLGRRNLVAERSDSLSLNFENKE